LFEEVVQELFTGENSSPRIVGRVFPFDSWRGDPRFYRNTDFVVSIAGKIFGVSGGTWIT